jgi:hypothetical protein
MICINTLALFCFELCLAKVDRLWSIWDASTFIAGGAGATDATRAMTVGYFVWSTYVS